MFAAMAAPRHNWAPAAAASVVFHVLMLACVVLVQQYLPLFSPDSLDGRYTLRMYPLNTSQRLYYFVERQEPRPAPRREGLPAPPPAAPRREGVRLSPQIRIPVLPVPPRADSLLIQPSTEIAKLVTALPSISAWAPRQRPAPKAFVQPGRPPGSPARPVLVAPPSVDRPSLAARLSDINFAAAPAVAAPALPRSPASTAPVGMIAPPQPQGEALNTGLGGKIGDPANLITAGPALLPPNTYVSVPAGVAGAAAGEGPATAAPGGGQMGGQGGRSGGSGSGAGGAAGPETVVIDVTAAREAKPPAGATRVTRPKDGRYSFLVMGSKPEESFPEAAGLLSGKLVYTVYLGIGARPDWILQYCLPNSASPAAAGPLDAPYPYLMFRPKLSFSWEEEYLFVKGMLRPEGKLEQLKLISEVAPADRDALLASLNRWEFRPATRGGKPAVVEVLLIVPKPQP
jgi:hypothetical protein